MSRVITDLTPGDSLYIDETVGGITTHVPYIYLGLDEYDIPIVLRVNALATKRMHNSNVASYAGCEMDTWLENTETGFMSRFDEATQNAMINTTIKYIDYNQSGDGTAQILEISRKCFLLSYSQMGFGNDAAGNEGKSFAAALNTYTGKTGAAARIAYGVNGTAVNVWLRSASSATNFRVCSTSGSASGGNASYASSCPRPAFSLDPNTPISDEDADEIFLLPDGRRTTWDIDMSMEVGTSKYRPKVARVGILNQNLSILRLWLCNNYGDAEPVWVEFPANRTLELENTTKETDLWRIGIKVYAEATTPDGYIGEPVVMVGTEEDF